MKRGPNCEGRWKHVRTRQSPVGTTTHTAHGAHGTRHTPYGGDDAKGNETSDDERCVTKLMERVLLTPKDKCTPLPDREKPTTTTTTTTKPTTKPTATKETGLKDERQTNDRGMPEERQRNDGLRSDAAVAAPYAASPDDDDDDALKRQLPLPSPLLLLSSLQRP